MKKLFIAAATLCAACALIVPKFVGTQVDQQTRQLVDTINQWPFYQAKLIDYSNGWFSNSGTLRLDIDLAAMFADGQPANLDNTVIDVQFETQHGPVTTSGFALSTVSLAVPAKALRQHLNWPNNTPFYQLSGKLDFEGGLFYQDTISSFNYESIDAKKIDVGQYKGYAETHNGVLKYQGTVDQITFDFHGVTTLLDKLSINAELPEKFTAYFDQTSLHNYQSKIGIEKVEVKAPQQQTLSLNGLALDMLSEVEPDTRLGHLQLIYQLKQYTYGEHQGNDLELNTQVRNLDETAFINLSQLLNNETAATNPDSYIENFNLGLKTHLLGLMTSQPEINISTLQGSFPEGDIQGFFNSKLIDVVKLPDDLEDKAFWLTHIKADSQIRASKKLTRVITQFLLINELRKNPNFAGKTQQELSDMAAQQVDGLLALLESQGTLVIEEDNYLVQFNMNKGQATLNGQSMPLPL